MRPATAYGSKAWRGFAQSGHVAQDGVGWRFRGAGSWIPETWDAANPPGQVLIDMTFAKGTPVTDPVIPVRLEGELALATRDGDILAHGKYQEMAGGFSDGLLKVRSSGRILYLRPDGAGTVAFEFVCPKKRHRRSARALGFFGNHAAVMVCGTGTA